MADRDAKRKRPITCLETGVTFESAYRAAKELGFADSRNIFRSIQRGTCTQGLHFYYADAPKPSPGFFLPPNRPPRPVVCLDTGETFDGNPAAARPLHVSPATISQAVRYGTPVAGLISTMETNRSRLRSSSSRSSPNAVRALCRWLPRLGPPRGTRVARTVASSPDARYNRCGR